MILKFLCSLMVELVRLLTMLTVCFLYLCVMEVLVVVINFNAATTTATGFEIMVNNNTLPLLASNGEALTALTEGLHIIVFDKQNNKLQLIV